MAIGLAIGLLMFAATDSLALLAVGVAIGFVFQSGNRR